MDKKKRIMGIAALSAAFATTLVLTITLPITCYGNQSVAATKFFKGLATKTEYVVGSSIQLSVNNVTNPENYDYLWYKKDSGKNSQPEYLNKTGQSITLDSASNAWNNAMIYCVLVLKPVNNPATYLVNKATTGSISNNLGNSINADDVALWTSTQLELSKPFSVSDCKISVQDASADNKVYVDSEDNVIVAPVNKAITLTASATFDKVYAPYVQYTWYKGNEQVQSSHSPTYTIPAASAPEAVQYKCVAQLVSGSSLSNQATSNSYTLNVVKSTNFAAGTTKVSVEGNSQETALTDIPAGNQVTLKASFTLDDQPLETNGKDYSVTYAWTQNGNPVVGDTANTDTLVLNNAQTTDSGSYVCTAYISFTNGGKIPVAAQPVTVSIVQPGVITIKTDLESTLNIANGDKTTLSINATLPSNNSGLQENLTYLWQYKTSGSDTWTNVENSGKPYSQPNLPLTAQQAIDLNGAQFQCVVSCSNPVAQVKPVTTKTLTLHVINPQLSAKAEITSPTTQLQYGNNVTLTATPTWDNQSNVTSTDEFKYNYSYQWYKKSNGAADWTPVSQNGNGKTLTILNLTSADEGTQYECKVTPMNVVTPTPAKAKTRTAVSEEPQSQAPGVVTNQFTTTSNPVTLNIAQFDFDVTAEATPVAIQDAQESSTLTNNLGDKFTVSLGQMQYKNGYKALPEGYQYVYNWVQSTSNDKDAVWTPITSGTPNQENPGQIESTEAGIFYYKCQITVAKKVASPDGTSQKTKLVKLTESPVYDSSLITVKTYPSATVTATQTSVNIVHNGSANLQTNIVLNTNTNTALSNKKVVKVEGNNNVEQQLQACGATYSWTYTPTSPSSSAAVTITPDNVKTYPFIEPGTCTTSTLGINTLNDQTSCDGTYSLTVTINGKEYKQSTPITVKEDAATFTVNSTAVAKLGSNKITLTANVQNTSNNQDGAGPSQGTGGGSSAVGGEGSSSVDGSKETQTANKSRKARNAEVSTEDQEKSPSYTYTWYVLDPNNQNKPVKLTGLQPNSSANSETLTLTNQTISSKWNNNLSFYCEVENNETHEIEWNTQPAKLQVKAPTINGLTITSTPQNGQLNYNTTLTLTTSGTTVSEEISGRNISYQWEYYNTKSSQWQPITPNDTNVSITNNGKTLEILDVSKQYQGLKIRCTASYGEGVTPVNSNEITVSLQTKELNTVTSDTLTKFATQIQSDFSKQNLSTTLQKMYSMTNNGSKPSEVNASVVNSWLNTILGTSQNASSSTLSPAFGENAVTVLAYPVKEQTTLPETLVAAESESNGVGTPGVQPQPGDKGETGEQGPAGPSGPAGQDSEQPAAPTYKMMLKFVFTANEGYTWPSNLNTAAQVSKQGLNYQASVDGQKLTVLVATNLTPTFTLNTSGTTSIDLSSQTSLTAKVTSTQSVSSYDWYAVTADGKIVAKITPPADGQKPSAELQNLFGENVTIQINNDSSDKSSTLTISNISVTETNSSLLNGLKIYATGVISKPGSYWQEIPCLTPFTVTCTPASAGVANHK